MRYIADSESKAKLPACLTLSTFGVRTFPNGRAVPRLERAAGRPPRGRRTQRALQARADGAAHGFAHDRVALETPRLAQRHLCEQESSRLVVRFTSCELATLV